jgi:hypothetical protein
VAINKKKPTLWSREFRQAIFDRRLYGLRFLLFTVPFLVVGFGVQFLIEYQLNKPMLLIYFPAVVVLVLITGLGTKNFKREISNMGSFRSFLFLLASFLAALTPFLLTTSNDIFSQFKFLLVFVISNIALLIAIVEITINGQRESLRSSLHLTEDYVKNRIKEWKKQLQQDPNFEKIIQNVEEAKFVPNLFDRGSFNLAILWSCGIMEKIVEIVAEDTVSRYPDKKYFFRDVDKRLGYPKQLKNLGFRPNLLPKRQDESLDLEKLWHSIRNDIVHRNYKPTFQETAGTIKILIEFLDQMPQVLISWETSLTAQPTTMP